MDEVGTNIVPYEQPASSSQCPADPCPYCELRLPHTATTTDVLDKCLAMTTESNRELNKVVCRYTRHCGAARHIVQLLGSDTDLPVAPTLFALLGEALVNDYVHHMAPLVSPGGKCPPPAPNVAPPPTGASASADKKAPDWSGRKGTPKGQKRWMAEDEFPQWQYRSGAKHNKWSTYERAANEQLEFSFKNGAVKVELCLGDWKYEVDLIDLTQLSIEFGTVRGVRRVAGPQDL